MPGCSVNLGLQVVLEELKIEETLKILKEEEVFSIGSLNNYEGDGNEDGKKAIGLNKKKQRLCTCITLFVHFFAVAVRLQRESA